MTMTKIPSRRGLWGIWSAANFLGMIPVIVPEIAFPPGKAQVRVHGENLRIFTRIPQLHFIILAFAAST